MAATSGLGYRPERDIELYKDHIKDLRKKNKKAEFLAIIFDLPWYFIIACIISAIIEQPIDNLKNINIDFESGVIIGIFVGLRLLACLIVLIVANSLKYHLGFDNGIFGKSANKFSGLANEQIKLPVYLTVWGGGLILIILFPFFVCVRYGSLLKNVERQIQKNEYIYGMTDEKPKKKKSMVLTIVQLLFFVFVFLKVFEII